MSSNEYLLCNCYLFYFRKKEILLKYTLIIIIIIIIIIINYFKQGTGSQQFGLDMGLLLYFAISLKVLIKFNYNKFLEVYHSHFPCLL